MREVEVQYLTLEQLFAEMMRKHFGAEVVSVNSVPLPSDEVRQREATLRTMTDDELVAAWETDGDWVEWCDEVYAEGQRRGLGDRICV